MGAIGLGGENPPIKATHTIDLEKPVTQETHRIFDLRIGRMLGHHEIPHVIREIDEDTGGLIEPVSRDDRTVLSHDRRSRHTDDLGQTVAHVAADNTHRITLKARHHNRIPLAISADQPYHAERHAVKVIPVDLGQSHLGSDRNPLHEPTSTDEKLPAAHAVHNEICDGHAVDVVIADQRDIHPITCRFANGPFRILAPLL